MVCPISRSLVYLHVYLLLQIFWHQVMQMLMVDFQPLHILKPLVEEANGCLQVITLRDEQ